MNQPGRLLLASLKTQPPWLNATSLKRVWWSHYRHIRSWSAKNISNPRAKIRAVWHQKKTERAHIADLSSIWSARGCSLGPQKLVFLPLEPASKRLKAHYLTKLRPRSSLRKCAAAVPTKNADRKMLRVLRMGVVSEKSHLKTANLTIMAWLRSFRVACPSRLVNLKKYVGNTFF